VVSVSTQTTAFINNTPAECVANPSTCNSYTLNANVLVGPNLSAVINGQTLNYILSQQLSAQNNGTIAWNLPDFGSLGTLATSTPSLDASNNFQTATFGVTSFNAYPGFSFANDLVGKTFSLAAANPPGIEGVLNGLAGVGGLALKPGSAKTLSASSVPGPSSVTLDIGSTSAACTVDGQPCTCTTQYIAEAMYVPWEVQGTADPGSPPPVCTGAFATVPALWPPNHKFISEEIDGVTASAPGPVSIKITGIHQDEQTLGGGSGDTCPDGQGIGTPTAQVRAERAGTGDGRVYHIDFTATDSEKSTCSGTVKVCVPHDNNSPGCVDQGPLYDSTKCP
jgi:hypothetical protein